MCLLPWWFQVQELKATINFKSCRNSLGVNEGRMPSSQPSPPCLDCKHDVCYWCDVELYLFPVKCDRSGPNGTLCVIGSLNTVQNILFSFFVFLNMATFRKYFKQVAPCWLLVRYVGPMRGCFCQLIFGCLRAFFSISSSLPSPPI